MCYYFWIQINRSIKLNAKSKFPIQNDDTRLSLSLIIVASGPSRATVALHLHGLAVNTKEGEQSTRSTLSKRCAPRMFATSIYLIHVLQNLISGCLLMRGYYPTDNVLEKNNPKKRYYKRQIAAGQLSFSVVGILSLVYGVDREAVHLLISPTLFLLHFICNLIQWNGISSTTSSVVSPHFFLSLGFGYLLLGQHLS